MKSKKPSVTDLFLFMDDLLYSKSLIFFSFGSDRLPPQESAEKTNNNVGELVLYDLRPENIDG